MRIIFSVSSIILICIVISCNQIKNNEINIKFTNYIKEYSKSLRDTIEGINIEFTNNLDNSIYLPTDKNSIFFSFKKNSEIDCGTGLGGTNIPTHYHIKWIEVRPNKKLNLIYRTKLDILKYSDVLTITGDYKDINEKRIEFKISCYTNKGKTLENIVYSDTFCQNLNKSLIFNQ